MDERDLFPEALRLIRECVPKAVLLENVRGLLDSKFRDYRQSILSELQQAGYEADWRLMQASDHGVSQRRPRAILVAIQAPYYRYFEWQSKCAAPPQPLGDLLHEALVEQGWKGANAWRSRANQYAVAPTLVGGSKKHGGADLGPTRAKKAWACIGVDAKGLAD